MSSHMSIYSCDILSSLYLCFGLLYFCCRILPSKPQDLTPAVFVSVSIYGTVILVKRESQHNGITIVFQLTTFLVTLFLF